MSPASPATEIETAAPFVPAGVKSITPPTIDLTLRGPLRLFNNLKLAPDAVQIDVAGLSPGTHTVPVRVTPPEGLTAVSQSPERVRVRVGGHS